jgi:predicted PurR-regulated permease PerM
LGELVWGIPGIILAIPLTAMLKIVYDHVESLKPYGFLLGEAEPGKKSEHDYMAEFKKWFKSKF